MNIPSHSNNLSYGMDGNIMDNQKCRLRELMGTMFFKNNIMDENKLPVR